MEKYIEDNLKRATNELNRMRESFDIMVQNELESDGNFESNAIRILVSMAQLKEEIRTLKQMQLLLTIR